MHLHFFNYSCFYLCPSVYESFKSNKELIHVGIKICQKDIIFVCLDHMQELEIYATKNIIFDELKKLLIQFYIPQNAFHRRLELITDQQEYIDFEEGTVFVVKKLKNI